MRNSKYFIHSIIISFLFFTTTVKGSTIHAFIVVNTNDYQKSDQGAINAWKISKNKIEEELNRIETYTNLGLEKYYFTDNKFIKYELQKSINQLSVGSNDVILFYFAGHGFNLINNECNYPNIVVSKKMNQYGKELYSDESIDSWLEVSINSCTIISQLRKKNARLLITLFETCNNQVYSDAGLFRPNNSKRNYKALYEDARGEVFITASKSGQGAKWDSKIGGYFTHYFLNELHKELKKHEISQCAWLEIGINTLSKLKIETSGDPDFESDEFQTPYGHILLYNKYNERICNK